MGGWRRTAEFDVGDSVDSGASAGGGDELPNLRYTKDTSLLFRNDVLN